MAVLQHHFTAAAHRLAFVDLQEGVLTNRECVAHPHRVCEAHHHQECKDLILAVDVDRPRCSDGHHLIQTLDQGRKALHKVWVLWGREWVDHSNMAWDLLVWDLRQGWAHQDQCLQGAWASNLHLEWDHHQAWDHQ